MDNGYLIIVEVISMANNNNKSQAGTNVQQVKQQNAQSQQGQGQFGTEFACETNVQEVRQQNAQSQQKKGQGQAQGQYGTEFAI